MKISCREDGTFTILQLTDMPIREHDKKDKQTYELCDMLIDGEDPDLIVLSGDVVHTKEEPEVQWKKLISYFDGKGKPWTFVYGNHDPECLTKDMIDTLLQDATQCLYEPGPEEICGRGNYVIQVMSKDGREVVAQVWSLDSGSGGDGPLKTGYDWVKEDQVAWFIAESDRLCNGAGKKEKITNLAFIHIPLPQHRTVWDTEVCTGYKYEDICEQGKDTGLFGAFVGKIDGVFVGHDHVNSFEGRMKGVHLCYGRGTGYNAYGRDGFQRGGRMLKIEHGEKGYSSYIRLADGSIADNPLHQPGASEFTQD